MLICSVFTKRHWVLWWSIQGTLFQKDCVFFSADLANLSHALCTEKRVPAAPLKWAVLVQSFFPLSFNMLSEALHTLSLEWTGWDVQPWEDCARTWLLQPASFQNLCFYRGAHTSWWSVNHTHLAAVYPLNCCGSSRGALSSSRGLRWDLWKCSFLWLYLVLVWFQGCCWTQLMIIKY